MMAFVTHIGGPVKSGSEFIVIEEVSDKEKEFGLRSVFLEIEEPTLQKVKYGRIQGNRVGISISRRTGGMEMNKKFLILISAVLLLISNASAGNFQQKWNIKGIRNYRL